MAFHDQEHSMEMSEVQHDNNIMELCRRDHATFYHAIARIRMAKTLKMI